MTDLKVKINQLYDIERIEPSNWWIGFKNKNLQLLVKHPSISEYTPEMSYKGVSLLKINKADSPNYLFLDLNISEQASAGKFNIVFKHEHKEELVQTHRSSSVWMPAI